VSDRESGRQPLLSSLFFSRGSSPDSEAHAADFFGVCDSRGNVSRAEHGNDGRRAAQPQVVMQRLRQRDHGVAWSRCRRIPGRDQARDERCDDLALACARSRGTKAPHTPGIHAQRLTPPGSNASRREVSSRPRGAHAGVLQRTCVATNRAIAVLQKDSTFLIRETSTSHGDARTPCMMNFIQGVLLHGIARPRARHVMPSPAKGEGHGASPARSPPRCTALRPCPVSHFHSVASPASRRRSAHKVFGELLAEKRVPIRSEPSSPGITE